MNEKILNNENQILIYKTEKGQYAVEVLLDGDTVWLMQKQLGELFGVERSVVTKHIRNIFKQGELEETAVCANFAHTAEDGKTYQTTFYNLDVIIALGYRVNAKRGTQFRIWATRTLKEHLIKGYTVNQKRLAETGVKELENAFKYFRINLKMVVGVTKYCSYHTLFKYNFSPCIYNRAIWNIFI